MSLPARPPASWPESRLRRLPGGLDTCVEGRIESLVVRSAQGGPARPLRIAMLVAGLGVEGDYPAAVPDSVDPERQVTLLQAEHLGAIARLLGRRRIDPLRLRRNLVLGGLNLAALLHARPTHRPLVRIGESVVLDLTEACEPCGRMDLELGPGGLHATHGHGGACARVLRGGVVRVGDAVRAVPRFQLATSKGPRRELLRGAAG